MSSINLRNTTGYVATYFLNKGDQVIARLPGIETNAQLTVPTNVTYQVVATTVIDGNTYTSAPIDVQGSMGFLARVLQVSAQGTYEFDVAVIPSTQANTLQFQATCLSPVTFTISTGSNSVQSVVVNNTNTVQTLNISDTYSVYAVINGITTDTSVFTNPNATITAITDNTIFDSGYFTLSIV